MGETEQPETITPRQGSGVFAIGLTTFSRNEVVGFTLPRLRAQFPNVPIYVADQNGDFENMTLYAETGVHPIWLEEDAGISKSRNRIMAQAKEPYVLLIDDDDLPEDHCDTQFIEALCSLLDENKSWFVIGGTLADRASYADSLDISRVEKGSLIRTKSTENIKADIFGDPVNLTKADIVLNFALFARERLLDSNVAWDEDLKVMEHTDFYLSLKRFREQTGRGEVLFFDGLRARQAAVARQSSYEKYRFRYQFLNLMARKWGLVRSVDASDEGPVVNWISRDFGWAAALNLLCGILKKQGLTHWVSNGTLLGLIRDGNFIAHDTDIDATVVGSENQLRSLESELLAAGFKFGRAFGVPGQGLEWAVFAPLPEEGNWPFGRIKIDLFFADKTSQGYKVATYRGRLASWKCLEQTSVERVAFPKLGLTLPIPADSKRVLEAEYGHRWETPTTEWDYWSSPRNICSGPKTEPLFRSVFYNTSLAVRVGSVGTLFEQLVVSKLSLRQLGLAASLIKGVVGQRGFDWIKTKLFSLN